MNRLIRAELYRFRHTGHYFWYVIFGMVIAAAIPFLSCIDLLDKDLGVLLGRSIDGVEIGGEMAADASILLLLMVLPPIVAVFSGQLYNRGKIGYYEIMAGNSPSRIILSKVLTDGLIYSVLTSIAVLTFYIYIGFANGLGGIECAAGRVILEIVLISQTCIVSVMIMMAARKPGAAGVLAYIRFILFDSMVIPFLMWLAGKMGLPKVAMFFGYRAMMNKMGLVLHGTIDTTIVFQTVFGFIGEFVLWYVIIYSGMKKKKYN